MGRAHRQGLELRAEEINDARSRSLTGLDVLGFAVKSRRSLSRMHNTHTTHTTHRCTVKWRSNPTPRKDAKSIRTLSISQHSVTVDRSSLVHSGNSWLAWFTSDAMVVTRPRITGEICPPCQATSTRHKHCNPMFICNDEHNV